MKKLFKKITSIAVIAALSSTLIVSISSDRMIDYPTNGNMFGHTMEDFYQMLDKGHGFVACVPNREAYSPAWYVRCFGDQVGTNGVFIWTDEPVTDDDFPELSSFEVEYDLDYLKTYEPDLYSDPMPPVSLKNHGQNTEDYLLNPDPALLNMYCYEISPPRPPSGRVVVLEWLEILLKNPKVKVAGANWGSTLRSPNLPCGCFVGPDSAPCGPDCSLNFLDYDFEKGEFTNPINTLDVNGDGDQSLSDVILIGKSISGKNVLSDEQKLAADCCRDNVINLKDLNVAVKYVLGDIQSLPVY